MQGIKSLNRKYSAVGNRISSRVRSGSPVDLRTVDKHFEEIKKFQYDFERQKEFYTKATDFRRSMHILVESSNFSGFIITVILINITMLFLSTWRTIERVTDYYFTFFDGVFLGIYFVEAALKIYVWRKEYFKRGWDLLDFFIVVISLAEIFAPLIVGQSVTSVSGTNIFKVLRVLRAFRSLRVLRTIKFLDNIQVILVTCLYSFKSLGAIMMLMTLFLVIFAVVGRGLFESIDERHFGNFGTATFTLIQLLTLDDWFEIFTGVTDQLGQFDAKMFFYLLFYIVIEFFVFLNLFIAVLVDNFQLTLQEKTLRKGEEKEQEELEKEMGLLYKFGAEDSASSQEESIDDLEKIKRELFGKSQDIETPSMSDDSSDHFDRDLSNVFIDQDKNQLALLESYYQILPALERESHMHNNAISCHDRIMDLVTDNTTEYK